MKTKTKLKFNEIIDTIDISPIFRDFLKIISNRVRQEIINSLIKSTCSYSKSKEIRIDLIKLRRVDKELFKELTKEIEDKSGLKCKGVMR